MVQVRGKSSAGVGTAVAVENRRARKVMDLIILKYAKDERSFWSLSFEAILSICAGLF